MMLSKKALKIFGKEKDVTHIQDQPQFNDQIIISYGHVVRLKREDLTSLEEE
jgi:hypothetical protein